MERRRKRLSEGWVVQTSKGQSAWVCYWAVWKQSGMQVHYLNVSYKHGDMIGWCLWLFFKEFYMKSGHSVCVMFLYNTLVAIPWLRYDNIKVLGVLPNVACWTRHSGKDRNIILFYLTSRLNKVLFFFKKPCQALYFHD